MTRAEKIGMARGLRKEGRSYRAIGEALGVSTATAFNLATHRPPSRKCPCGQTFEAWHGGERFCSDACRFDADHQRKREWEKGECPGCGGPFVKGHSSKQCRECHLGQKREEIRTRIEHFIELRKAGFNNREIEEMEELAFNTVAGAFTRYARRLGLTVPPSPCRRRAAA